MGGRHLDRRSGRSRYVASTSATARSGTRTYLLDVALDRRRKKWRTDERWGATAGRGFSLTAEGWIDATTSVRACSATRAAAS